MQRDNRRNWVNTQGVRGAVTLDQHERVTSVAPFAQVTAAAGPFSLFSGIRYDRVRFAVTDALITPMNPDDSGARNMTAFSPSVGISYTLFSGTTIYTNVASAFQTPTTTELANSPTEAGGFNPALSPERIRSVEAGLNGRFLGRGSYHAALYRMRIRDALVPFGLASFPGRQFYRNVGEATHRGAEAEAGAIFTSHVSGRLAYTYTDARFTVDTAGALSNTGDRLPGVIPHTLTASLDAGTTRGRFVTVETRAQSSTPVNDANTIHSPGYVTVALRGNFPLYGGTALFGGIGNLLNRRYNTSVVANAVGGRYFEPAAGRTVYLGVDLKRIAP
jgi:iron complex outermembrane recepter protein